MEILTALITPFHQDYRIDYDALKRLVERLMKEGCRGFVVCGTTAEAPTLRNEEKISLLKFVLEHVNEDCEVWYGCGGNDTLRTLEQMQAVEHLKFSGYLLVCPYYNKPNQEGLYQHFAYLAKYSKHPMMLYHVPHRCGVSLTYDVIDKLIQKYSNIVALKHADANFQLVKQLKVKYPDFKIYSGEDTHILESINAGCDGFVSVLSHVSYKAMMHCINNHQSDEILQKQAELLFSDASPNVIKYILSMRNECQDVLRLPLTSLKNESIKNACAQYF